MKPRRVKTTIFDSGKRVGQFDRGPDGLVANADRLGLLVEACPAGLLHSACDAIKYLHAFNRILADRRLTAQHDRVRLLEDSICHISDLRARRQWIFDHRLEHVRCDDNLSARLNAPHDHPSLDDWEFFHWTLDAQGRRERP